MASQSAIDTDIEFDEIWYLERYPDVASAIRPGGLFSGLQHYLNHGRSEGRLPVRPPAARDTVLRQAQSLRERGEAAAADALLQAAVTTYERDSEMFDAFGLNAMAQNKWPIALARFQDGCARFPGNPLFGERIVELQLRAAGTQAAEAARDLVMRFESLGGSGHGCEFGIFQRHFGAEPLGLLRWADLGPDQLSQALESEFAGVADADLINLFVADGNGRPEYWMTHKVYHMAMRCFVYPDEVPQDRIARQVMTRLGFLRDKLIEDLRATPKIFVFKHMRRNLADHELDRLYQACRRYGDNTLLYVRYEDAAHPNGTVRVDRPGLMIGYIDHFSHHAETDEMLDNAHESWLTLCRRAHEIYVQLGAN